MLTDFTRIKKFVYSLSLYVYFRMKEGVVVKGSMVACQPYVICSILFHLSSEVRNLTGFIFLQTGNGDYADSHGRC